jgi:DNA-binding response OmpR family regulator
MHEVEDRASGVTRVWRPTTPARIVVAGNDGEMRGLVIAKLLDDGHEVYGASSASGLLRLLAAGGSTIPPLDGADLIVLDQDLPGSSGIEIVRRLRIARSKIPCLLMAAHPSNELLREAKQLRVPVLVKPFALWELSNAALLLMITRMSVGDEARPLAAIG